MIHQFKSTWWNWTFRKEVEYGTKRCTICLRNNAEGRTKTPVMKTKAPSSRPFQKSSDGLYFNAKITWLKILSIEGRFPNQERHSCLYYKNVCGREMDISRNGRTCPYHQRETVQNAPGESPMACCALRHQNHSKVSPRDLITGRPISLPETIDLHTSGIYLSSDAQQKDHFQLRDAI